MWPARFSSRAAVSPAMPAPTMITEVGGPCGFNPSLMIASRSSVFTVAISPSRPASLPGVLDASSRKRETTGPMTRDLQIGDVTVPGRVLVAPMTGISDLPFRRAASRQGAAYVATEMVACAELARGRPDVVRRAAVGEGLPLTVIQLVGREAGMMAAGARMAEKAGADLIDINMGCPAKEVTGIASGSALMRDLDLAERLIRATVEATSRPVTLKMRLGWDAASICAAELAARAEAAGVVGRDRPRPHPVPVLQGRGGLVRRRGRQARRRHSGDRQRRHHRRRQGAPGAGGVRR